MAQILTFDPSSGEAQSPIIAGITEALNKISSILDMETTVYEETQMLPIYIDTKLENKNRIYQVDMGKRLWLSSVTPIIRKNGSVINSATDSFEIDYIGGSIAFYDNHNLLDSDIVTATITSVNDKSTVIYDILNDISLLKTKASHDKGFFATQAALLVAHPTGVDGDNAIVGSTDTTWLWDSGLSEWTDTHKATDLSNYYTKPATDNLLNTKEPNISAKGATLSSDDFYYGGRKQWIDLLYKIKNTVLTGIDVAAVGTVTAVDNIISALGKLQSQITTTNTKATQEIDDRKQGDVDTLATAESKAKSDLQAHSVYATAHANRFDLKSDKSTTYTKTEVDTRNYTKAQIDTSIATINTNIGLKADKTAVYTKAETDTKLNLKMDKTGTYTKAEIDTKVNLKADTTAMNTALALKADTTAMNTALGLKADKTKMPVVRGGAIANSLFVANADFADYPLRATVAITGVLAADSVDIILNVPSIAIATAAEIANITTAYAGGIYMYAKTKPTGTLTCTINITRG